MKGLLVALLFVAGCDQSATHVAYYNSTSTTSTAYHTCLARKSTVKWTGRDRNHYWYTCTDGFFGHAAHGRSGK